MKMAVRVLAVAIAAAAFFAFSQRREISAARTELARLEAGGAVASSSSTGASDSTGAPGSTTASAATLAEIARLREENRDIHKLRGQITLAREKRREFERLQAENVKFQEQIRQLQANPQMAAAPPVPLSNKGQATPEAAVETTFWAMHQGDVGNLSRLMPAITEEFERMPLESRTNFVTMLRAMAASIEQFEIVERKMEPSGDASVKIKITRREGMNLGLPPGSDNSTFVLRRTNDLWQIVGQR